MELKRDKIYPALMIFLNELNIVKQQIKRIYILVIEEL